MLQVLSIGSWDALHGPGNSSSHAPDAAAALALPGVVDAANTSALAASVAQGVAVVRAWLARPFGSERRALWLAPPVPVPWRLRSPDKRARLTPDTLQAVRQQLVESVGSLGVVDMFQVCVRAWYRKLGRWGGGVGGSVGFR
jgi:hypothetical protein